MSRFRCIAVEKAHHPVAVLCRVLEVSTSGFDAWMKRPPSDRARADRALTARIRSVHQASRGTYGAPRVHAELRAQGTPVARKRIARLMRTAGLAGCRPRRFVRTTVADRAAAAPDLVQRQFTAAAPDQVWLTDITYVPTNDGWLYLAAILDAYSRRVVGWSLADHLRTDLVLGALAMALQARQPAPGLIHHSDRGCQYTAAAYTTVLAAHGLRQSLGQPGTCWDNAVAESFFATLKTELVHRQRWTTRQQAKTAIFEYLEVFYNRQRRHSSLGYQSPAEFEANRRREVQAA
jgi:putative transposase